MMQQPGAVSRTPELEAVKSELEKEEQCLLRWRAMIEQHLKFLQAEAVTLQRMTDAQKGQSSWQQMHSPTQSEEEASGSHADPPQDRLPKLNLDMEVSTSSSESESEEESDEMN